MSVSYTVQIAPCGLKLLIRTREKTAKSYSDGSNLIFYMSAAAAGPVCFYSAVFLSQKEAGKNPMSKCKDQYDLAHDGKNGIVIINP